MNTGDIILLRSKGIIPSIIRFITNSYYNHAGIIIKINDIFYVSEADKYGIKLTPFNGYKERYGEILIMERIHKITEQQEKDLINFVLYHTTEYKYDYFSFLIRFPIRYLFERLFKKTLWIKDKNPYKRFTCSEWVCYVVKNIFNDKWTENCSYISPEDIYLFFNNYKK